MGREPKHDYPALIQEYDQRRLNGESHRSIQATFEARGIHWRTFNNRRSDANKERAQETTMRDESPAEVLPGQVRIDEADTPTEMITEIVPAIADIPTVTAELVEDLSPIEVQTLEQCEAIIAQGIKTFVEVGNALTTIRDQHLYRQAHSTFEAYLRQRWDLSRPYAYQLMEASEVVKNVSAVADIQPANEAQTRPLATLPPEQQREVWKEAVETAPGGKPTAKHVQAMVNRKKGKPATPRPGSVGAILEAEERHTPPLQGPPHMTEFEWIQKFDARCVRIHEFLGELTRAGGVEVFVRRWSPEHQAEFLNRATHWTNYLDNFRRHLARTINGSGSADESTVEA